MIIEQHCASYTGAAEHERRPGIERLASAMIQWDVLQTPTLVNRCAQAPFMESLAITSQKERVV